MQTLRLVLVLIVLVHAEQALGWQQLAALTNSTTAFTQSDSSQRVESLIRQMDSREFSQREKATKSIVKYGDRALPALTRNFFKASPETNYRIRKALEGIASTGDESLFLRSSAILLTLYANGNDKIFQQIEEIKIKWQTQRTEQAIQSLRDSGAEVTQQQGYAGNAAQPLRVEFVGGRAVAIQQNTATEVEPGSIKVVKRTPQQQRRMVEAILVNDAKANRDFIFELMPEQAKQNDGLSVNVMSRTLPLLAGTTIVFPEDWAAKNTDPNKLDEFKQIGGRLFLNVTKTNLSKAHWKSIVENDNVAALTINVEADDATLPKKLPKLVQTLTVQGAELDSDFIKALEDSKKLQQLYLINCKLTRPFAKRIDGIQSIKNLTCEFTNYELDDDQVEALSLFTGLRALHLDAVSMDRKALAKLRELSNLNVLYVSKMPATKTFFENVRAIPKLRTIQFKSCKLDIDAYRKVEAERRITMNFEAQAFLGVQGSSPLNVMDPDVVDTMISMVVPNSAAAEGGVKVGDIIQKINGEQVGDFDDVRLRITQFAAGDTIALEVQRSGKPKTLTVTLRDYETARKF